MDCNSSPYVNRKVLFTPTRSPEVTSSFLSVADSYQYTSSTDGVISSSVVASLYQVDITTPKPETSFYLRASESGSVVVSASVVSGDPQYVFFDLIYLIKDPFDVRKVTLTPVSNYPVLFSGSIVCLNSTSSITDATGSCYFASLVPAVYQVDCIGKVTTTFYISVPTWENTGSDAPNWNAKDLLVVTPSKGIKVKVNGADNSYVLTVSASDARYGNTNGTASYVISASHANLADTASLTLTASYVGNYVLKSGDTMTGPLIVSSSINTTGNVLFGGTDANFPSIKRSGADIKFRLADDSGYAHVYCKGIYPDEYVWLGTGNQLVVISQYGIDAVGNAITRLNNINFTSTASNASATNTTRLVCDADNVLVLRDSTGNNIPQTFIVSGSISGSQVTASRCKTDAIDIGTVDFSDAPLNIKVNGAGKGFIVSNSGTEYMDIIAGGVLKGFRGYGSIPFVFSNVNGGNSVQLNSSGDNEYTASGYHKFAGHLKCVPDNTYDIGDNSGAGRPRNIYAAGTVYAAGIGGPFGAAFNEASLGAGWTISGRLMFGGTTTSFPALKRNNTTLECKLADDSAYTNFAAAHISCSVITASLFTGTASYATTAGTVTSASFASSATSASWASVSISASYAPSAPSISASYADTASYAVNIGTNQPSNIHFTYFGGGAEQVIITSSVNGTGEDYGGEIQLYGSNYGAPHFGKISFNNSGLSPTEVGYILSDGDGNLTISGSSVTFLPPVTALVSSASFASYADTINSILPADKHFQYSSADQVVITASIDVLDGYCGEIQLLSNDASAQYAGKVTFGNPAEVGWINTDVNGVMTISASTLNLVGSSVNLVGSRNIISSIALPVQSAKLPSTSSARIDAAENNWRLLYDASAPQSASWQLRVPSNYLSNPTVSLVYSMNATQTGSNAVIWRVSTFNPSTSTDVNTVSNISVIYTSSLSSGQAAGKPVYANVPIANSSITASNYCLLTVERMASATADTATSDAELLALSFEFNS